MVGDYTRTGISTMINTGSYFGMVQMYLDLISNKLLILFMGKDAKVDLINS